MTFEVRLVLVDFIGDAAVNRENWAIFCLLKIESKG